MRLPIWPENFYNQLGEEADVPAPLPQGRQADGHDCAEDKAQALIREIERLGVEPFEASAPLPAIDPEEINLVCWMGIEKAS